MFSSARAIASGLRTSPRTNSTSRARYEGRRARVPCTCGAKLSSTRTEKPDWINSSARCDPTKPAPPVISTFFCAICKLYRTRARLEPSGNLVESHPSLADGHSLGAKIGGSYCLAMNRISGSPHGSFLFEFSYEWCNRLIGKFLHFHTSELRGSLTK